ncbi:protein iws1-like protein, partial [Lasius niger]
MIENKYKKNKEGDRENSTKVDKTEGEQGKVQQLQQNSEIGYDRTSDIARIQSVDLDKELSDDRSRRSRSRVKRRKGVISDWDIDMPLYELVEAMDNTKGILQMEKLRKRYVDPKTKQLMNKYSHQVLITVEGNELPTEIKIFGGLMAVK